MTCVVGLEYDGEVVLGFDSLGAGSFSAAGVRVDAKGWRQESGGYWFTLGGTTSYRMLQILRYHATPPDPNDDHREYSDLDEWWLQWMVTRYVPHVRTALKEQGYTTVNNNNESGGQWLIGVDGRLFAIDSDFQVRRQACGYEAVGSGYAHAEGAMYAQWMRSGELHPDDVLVALRAAQEHGAGVRQPFHLISTNPERSSRRTD